MNRILEKGLDALKNNFSHGDMIRHIYKNSTAIGIIQPNGYIVSNGEAFTSISTFAKNHKMSVVGRPIQTDGWTECHWKKADESNTEWKTTYNKRLS
jgi:hypothetical protein